jgi:hypothetical protein
LTILRAKFSVEEAQARFLDNFKAYGFKDKSSMLRAAIAHFKKEMELESLRKSDDLYSEIYAEDDELRELTENALSGWPQTRLCPISLSLMPMR